MKKLFITSICFAAILLGYSQNENAIIEGGELILKPNMPQNPVAGTIIWTGKDFKGFNGDRWISLTGAALTPPIEIGNYSFQFSSEFVLVPGQGIDSYIGNINGDGISLSFDYGWFTRPSSNLSATEYVVTENEIDGHFKQIVKPFDSQNNFTKIHLYKISDQINSPNGYNSLTIRVKNITLSEQEMIIDVFNSVTF